MSEMIERVARTLCRETELYPEDDWEHLRSWAVAALSALPLREWLAKMEADWSKIEGEWGSGFGTIEKEIAKGHEPEIAQLRALVAALK